jgi:hypothetical protein
MIDRRKGSIMPWVTTIVSELGTAFVHAVRNAKRSIAAAARDFSISLVADIHEATLGRSRGVGANASDPAIPPDPGKHSGSGKS